jgi:hypothetical protein
MLVREVPGAGAGGRLPRAEAVGDAPIELFTGVLFGRGIPGAFLIVDFRLKIEKYD